MNSTTFILEHSDNRCLNLGRMAPELCTGWNILLTSALDKFATRRLGSRAVLTLMLVIAGAGESMRTRSCMSKKSVTGVLRRNFGNASQVVLAVGYRPYLPGVATTGYVRAASLGAIFRCDARPQGTQAAQGQLLQQEAGLRPNLCRRCQCTANRNDNQRFQYDRGYDHRYHCQLALPHRQ